MNKFIYGVIGVVIGIGIGYKLKEYTDVDKGNITERKRDYIEIESREECPANVTRFIK